MHSTTADWLSVCPFGYLSNKDSNLLLRHSEIVEFRKKQQIYKQGQTRESVFYITDGFARQTRQIGDEGEVTVAILGPNELLGLLGLIEHSPYMLSAVAITDVRAVKIPVVIVRELLDRRSAFLRYATEMLSTHLSQAYKAITQSGYSRVDQRILSALLEFGSRYGESHGGQLHLSVPLTRNDIAAISHTTVETTIRTLGKWKKEGWITTRDRKIILTRLDCLVKEVLNRS